MNLGPGKIVVECSRGHWRLWLTIWPFTVAYSRGFLPGLRVVHLAWRNHWTDFAITRAKGVR